MKINHSEYTISELLGMLKKREVFINKTYQRGAGLWPDTARTYFIDTILEGFPFPKLYFYQSFDRSKRKPIKEVVDGQQRLTTIRDFVENKIRLGSASSNYSGRKFDDLEEETQEEFLMYTVPADVILAAEKPILLEMFRRINSYTAPLNSAEKRHSEFQGPFKWFINDNADKYSHILEEYGVLTPKQIVRMGDAEFLAELSLVIDQGITYKSSQALKKLYKKYDEVFSQQEKHQRIIDSFFDALTSDFEPLRDSFMMKPYALHSLFTAMIHLKYGIPNGFETLGCTPIKSYYEDLDCAISGLSDLADAHETQDIEGQHSVYVKACIGTTTKVAQRKIRSKAIIHALLCE